MVQSQMQMIFSAYRIADRTAVPETTVKFIHGVGLEMETIDGVCGPGGVILASIARVLKVMQWAGWG